MMSRGQRAERTLHGEGLGGSLRRLRRERGLSLAALSAASGVPVSTISKIENHQLSPSLVHAINLAGALGANLGFLVEQETAAADFTVVRRGERARLDFPELALTLEDLHGDFAPGLLEARLGTLGIGACSGEEPMRHRGEEVCHVLEGAVRYIICGEVFDLGAGDTIHFWSDDPHLWRNIHPGPSRVLWVFSDGLSF